jgi:hypothetical protein
MAVLLGNQTLRCVPPAGELIYPLRVPLQQRTPAGRKRRFVRTSLDYTHRDVTVIGTGSGVPEVHAVIRYDENPELLLALLEAGADGYPVYWHNGIREIPCMQLEPSGDLLQLMREEVSLPYLEFTVEVVLQPMDGTPAGSLVR